EPPSRVRWTEQELPPTPVTLARAQAPEMPLSTNLMPTRSRAVLSLALSDLARWEIKQLPTRLAVPCNWPPPSECRTSSRTVPAPRRLRSSSERSTTTAGTYELHGRSITARLISTNLRAVLAPPPHKPRRDNPELFVTPPSSTGNDARPR